MQPLLILTSKTQYCMLTQGRITIHNIRAICKLKLEVGLHLTAGKHLSSRPASKASPQPPSPLLRSDKCFVPPSKAAASFLNELFCLPGGECWMAACPQLGTAPPNRAPASLPLQQGLFASLSGHQEVASKVCQMWLLSPQVELLFSLWDPCFLRFYQITVITKASLKCSKAPIKPLAQGLFGLGVFQLGEMTCRHK